MYVFTALEWICFAYAKKIIAIKNVTCVPNINTPFIFITHQHAMHAERDIALPVLSVCPSICLSVGPKPIVCQNKWTYHYTFIQVFSRPTTITKFEGESPKRGAKYKWWENCTNAIIWFLFLISVLPAVSRVFQVYLYEVRWAVEDLAKCVASVIVVCAPVECADKLHVTASSWSTVRTASSTMCSMTASCCRRHSCVIGPNRSAAAWPTYILTTSYTETSSHPSQ